MFNLYPYLNIQDLNLDWIISHFKEFVDAINGLEEWRHTHEAEYEELKAFMDSINAGNLPEAMIDSMNEWLQENAYDIIGSMIKHVYFGLTNDGYFCAFIPDNWNNIQFDTVTDFDDPLYGHLVLMYD